MTDRPIIFSGPMVKAMIDGRKTQTRRIIKIAGRWPDYVGPRGCTDDPKCWGWEDSDHGDYVTIEREPGQRMGWRDWRGAYRVGDRLYVREAHYMTDNGDEQIAVYAEDEAEVVEHKALIARLRVSHALSETWAAPHLKLRPSIHMPRWASRLTLMVTDVRVQRLQDISEDDARAEGAKPWTGACQSYVTDFAAIWRAINGPDAWDANPWVAAISFTVQRLNIDHLSDQPVEIANR